ncbi:MAG: tRNA guanosine(34) transglycosylase Tgt [archaeon]
MFRIESQDRLARTGVLSLKHGKVRTPELMPVATKATVKAIPPESLAELGVQLVICNTYHLMLRPGADIISRVGGLNRFMGTGLPLVTDSGGFQAFSLGLGSEHATGKMSLFFPEENKTSKKPRESIVRMTDRGIYFRSVYDRSRQFLSPEDSIMIQEQLGADMILALDECTSPLSDKKYTEKSLQRTHKWAKRCLKAHKSDQAIAGIIQGGHWQDLRKESARFISELPFDGIAIGGSLGRSKKDMHSVLDWTIPLLPKGKPRHLLGIGVVEDIFEAVERGIDLFDCVSPTRMARSGYAYVRPPAGTRENKFNYSVKAKRYRADRSNLDANCRCRVCEKHSRAYIHHLLDTNEMLGHTLLSYHNINFFMQLMRDIREAIRNSGFLRLKKAWLG